MGLINSAVPQQPQNASSVNNAQTQNAAAAQPTAQQAQPQQGQPQLSKEQLQAHIKNIEKAAHLFMYNKATTAHFQQSLKAELQHVPPKVAAAKIAAQMMMMFIGQSHYAMSQQAVIPAGVMIAGEVLDFVGKIMKVPIEEKDAHDVIALFAMAMKQMIAKSQGAVPQAQPAPAPQGA